MNRIPVVNEKQRASYGAPTTVVDHTAIHELPGEPKVGDAVALNIGGMALKGTVTRVKKPAAKKAAAKKRRAKK